MPRWTRSQLENGLSVPVPDDDRVFPYDDVPHASASGAVRVGLATGVPVLASPTRWFEELGDAVHRDADPAEGVRRLLEDEPLRRRTVEAARAHCREHSWSRCAARHAALWRSLTNR